MIRTRRWRSELLVVGLCLASTISCDGGDRHAPSALTTVNAPSGEGPHDVVRGSCVDRDGDGFGAGCVLGPDCDDDDARVTRECRACLRPEAGCACAETEAPVPCNLETGTTENGPDGVCRLGQRVCRDARWSQCEAFERESTGRFFGVASPCSGQCDPSCNHIVDCVTASDTLPASATGVAVSDLPQAVFCPAGTPSGGVQPWCESRPAGPYTRSPTMLSWIDACAAPGSVTVLAAADEGVATVLIPFSFSYWGVPYRSLNVTPNGVAEFAASASQWVNTTLPAPSAPNSVFAFWDDLVMRSGVCAATVGTAPNRRMVLEWSDAGFYPAADPSTHMTFEVILSEATQTVDVLYNTMQGVGDLASGSSATIGVQEGGGTRFDLVGYNTPGIATAGAGFQWSPTSNDQYCGPGVYRRTFEASCPADSVASIATWGLLNYSSRVQGGSAIRMEVRAADTSAGVSTAAPIRLPDAARTTSAAPLTTSFDLGDILYAGGASLAHARFVELTAYLDPGPDSNLAPTLGSIEMQFRCRPVEAPFRCQAGSPCLTSGVCRSGAIVCTQPLTPVCADAGPLPVGTSCGPLSVCDAAGNCVPCNEGATCDTGNPCEFGRITCATGAPVCARASFRPAGTACAFGTSAYTRDASSLGWIDACALAGSATYLPSATDSSTDLTLPFPFRFYGTVRTSAGVSTNGVLAFPSGTSVWANTALPSAALPDAILPFWDDLQTRPAGLCVATLGRAPGRLFIVEWANADVEDRGVTGNLGASLNFEVVLEEATQAVDVIYGDMVGDARATGSGATVGIQRGDGTLFDQYAFNTANAVRPNSSIRWTPPIASACNGGGTCAACTTGEVCDGLDNNCNGVIDEMCAGSIACPADATMFAGDARSFTVTTAGVLHSFQWSIIGSPVGGDTTARWAPTPPVSATESFQPIIVGTYRIQVSAVDGLNATRSCAFNVTANSRGLRVELTWNGAGDVDLHLHDNVSGAWFTTPNDCHYANMAPAWGAAQDVDNVSANGPENIRMTAPVVGQTYTVAVHHYAHAAGRVATVKIYCGPTAGTTPSAVYASAPLVGNSTGNCTANTFWRVASVRSNADGSCTITPINTASTGSNACATR